MITKGKPRGVPFKPGTDERRNLTGSRNREAVDFKEQFKQILHEEVNIKKLVRVLLRKAEQGVPWAMQEVLDRGLGKAVQFTDNKLEAGATYRIVYAAQPGFPSLPAKSAPGQLGPAACRLLEAGKDAEAAKDQDQDYVEACKQA